MKIQTWTVKKGCDKRIRSGHPWIFANELASSPKGIIPGSPIELLDAQGKFLAWGYGNPHSLISFRALSFLSHEVNFLEPQWLLEKILRAWKKRIQWAMKYSYRLVYSEADGLPGLIIDYYTLQKENQNFQVFACQILTAGMQRLISNLTPLIENLVSNAQKEGLTHIPWTQTAVVARNDSKMRSLEGLPVESPMVLYGPKDLDLTQAQVQLKGQLLEKPLTLKADLLGGQKTGLFLDQSWNIQIVSEIVRQSWSARQIQSVRILDLCCYVGQWSAHLAQLLRSTGLKVEVALLDASPKALALAAENLKQFGVPVATVCDDVLKALPTMAAQHYDLVIADPPAFIKNKRDIPQGRHGYMKLNAEAFRLCATGGFVVSCSCSALLSEEEFQGVLAKAAQRVQRSVVTLARGGQALDHPSMNSFPEGRYLKMYLQTVF